MRLNLDFIATERGGLTALRATCIKRIAQYKRAAIVAHYQAIVDAIDARGTL